MAQPQAAPERLRAPRVLSRKRWRDLKALKTQALAICLVMACGVATFVMSLSTVDSLVRMQETYHEDYRFADVFLRVKRAPRALVPRIAALPGVETVATRTVHEVTLDIPGMVEPAVGRLISTDRPGRLPLNALHLRQGRWIDPHRGSEVLVHEAFAAAHGLSAGARIPAVLNGQREILEVVGVVLSPEYVFQMRGGELAPDERRFGVFWMGERALAAAFDMEGAFNDVALRLAPGARPDEVLERLDGLLDRYGGQGAYLRKDQSSHHRAMDELEQLRGWSVIPPTIFLLVSGFLLNMVVARLVGAQRAQIGVLRAFGITRGEIARHYLGLVFTLVAVSAAVGLAVGRQLGIGLAGLYARYYHFPTFQYHLDARVVAAAFLVAAGAALLGTLGAVRRAAAVPPAEAMAPEPPASYRPSWVERTGFLRFLRQTARIVLRNVERRPVRASLSTLGIALALAVLILGTFLEDAAGALMHFEFQLTQRQDVVVSLVEPVGGTGALAALQRLPGVRQGQGFRSVPTRLRYGHRSHRQGVLGLAPEPQLFRLLDADLRSVPIPQEGLLLSRNLADLLQVGLGDTVTVEILEGERPVHQVPVTGLFTAYVGTAAYMDLRGMQRLLGEGHTLSGAFLSVDPARRKAFYQRVKATPRLAGVQDLAALRQAVQAALEENLFVMKAVNMAFAVIIAFGVVYNSARISLMERAVELGTLRVIGFTRREISSVLLGELGLLTLLALPPGLLLGYLFSAAVTVAMATETHRFPLVIELSTYIYSVLVVALAALGSGLVVRRRLDRLDLVAVLKARE